MPKGPQGQKRPADVIGNAIKIARIATGEEEEDHEAPRKGRAGGEARAKSLSADRRSQIARKAAVERWVDSKTKDRPAE